MALQKLNFPEIQCRFQKNEKGSLQLFDIIRRKFVDVTPEEWVRQHIIHYLMMYKNVPISMFSVEKQLILNNTKKRTDIVVFNTSLKPLMIIECKAPNVELNQLTIDQILRYNLKLNVPFIILSNGLKHIAIKLESGLPVVLSEIPDFNSIKNEF